MKYVKKPIPIEAVQFPHKGDVVGVDALEEWAAIHDPDEEYLSWDAGYVSIEVKSLEGPIYGVPGDWICKGDKEGEYWINREDIFAERYEPFVSE